jgi:hypothetical protein
VASKENDGLLPAGFSKFYSTRRRVYGILLLFVIVVGLPLAAVPKLRNRLVTRAQVLGDAFAGKQAPALIQVGESHEPFPAEFERPAPPVPQVIHIPQHAEVHSTAEGGYVPRGGEIHPPSRAGIPEALQPSSSQGEGLSEQAETGLEEAPAGPKYKQGAVEKDAYDLVVQSDPAIAEIAKGNNPSLKFKSWDAAGRGDDVYWVRLILQTQTEPDAEFIWQVNLQSKQVMPLNYNAHTIP